MSSYLNFYVVPKQKEEEKEEQKLLLMSYCRVNDLYSAYVDELNVSYNDYKKVTAEDSEKVLKVAKKELEDYKQTVATRTEAIKNLPNLTSEIVDEYVSEYVSSKEYITELENTVSQIEFITDLLRDLEYSSFEPYMYVDIS